MIDHVGGRVTVAADAALDWDKNLDAIKVSLIPAQVASGSPYWRLVRASYDPRATGRCVVYCEVQNEKGERIIGQKLTLSWPGGAGSTVTENKPAPEFAANFGLGSSYDPSKTPGPYTVGVDDLPSDKVAGLGRPQGRDAVFYLTWRRATAGAAAAKSTLRGLVIGGTAGMTVTLRPASGAPLKTSLDAAGVFVFTGLPAGTYTLEVGSVKVTDLRLDGTASLDVPAIDLRPRQSIIKGTVLAADGSPLANATVVLTNSDSRKETKTDARGAYQFSGLLAGTYSIEVNGQVLTATVNGRDQATVDFRMPAELVREALAQYVLFGPPQLVGTRANMVLAEDYILTFTPACGFRVEEAMLAATVIIVGDQQAVSAADEERLKASGCQVTRLGGGAYAIEQAFAELVKGRGVSPVPSTRLRGPRPVGRDGQDA